MKAIRCFTGLTALALGLATSGCYLDANQVDSPFFPTNDSTAAMGFAQGSHALVVTDQVMERSLRDKCRRNPGTQVAVTDSSSPGAMMLRQAGCVTLRLNGNYIEIGTYQRGAGAASNVDTVVRRELIEVEPQVVPGSQNVDYSALRMDVLTREYTRK